MRHVKSSGVGATVRMLYPRMLAVHLFPDDVGFPDETGRLVMPQAIRCSYARMEPHGAYLVGTFALTFKLQQTWIAKTRCGNAENGEKAILWLGQAVSPAILQDLYSVENLDELDTRMVNSFLPYLLLSSFPDSFLSNPRRLPSPIFLPDYLLRCATFFLTLKSEQVDNCPSSSHVKISMEPKLNSQTCSLKTRTTSRYA